MKTTVTIALVVMCLACGACGNNEQAAPQKLCGDLETFTLKKRGYPILLTGIRNRVTGDTLVAPQLFIDIVADKYVVKAQLPDKRWMVYSDRGLPLLDKPFDAFTHFKMEDNREFYNANIYDKRYFYFPQRHQLLDVTQADLSRGDTILIPQPDGTIKGYGYPKN